MLTALHDSDHEVERIEMAAEMIQDAREDCEAQAAQSVIALSEEGMRSLQIQVSTNNYLKMSL